MLFGILYWNKIKYERTCGDGDRLRQGGYGPMATRPHRKIILFKNVLKQNQHAFAKKCQIKKNQPPIVCLQTRRFTHA